MKGTVIKRSSRRPNMMSMMVDASFLGCKPNSNNSRLETVLGDQFPDHLSSELRELFVPTCMIVGELVVIEP